VDKHITVAAVLDQLPQASAPSSIWKRKARSWVFLIATVISFVTAVFGFVDAFQHPEKQIFAIGLLAVVIVILVIQLIRANIVRRKQHQIVHITPITSIMIDAQLQQQLTHQSPLSARQIWIRRCVRIIDNIGWVLLAMVLTLAAGAVFVFSLFGLYEAIRTEVSIFDVVMIIGLVRPLNSTLNGIKKLQQKTIGTRRRLGTFSKSLHYMIESVNHFIHRLHLSTAEIIRTGTAAVSHVGGGIATTASTVALSVTVSGMGLASAQVAPSAVIATGQVIPLPPVIANVAGPAGHDVAVRGAVFYGCMGNILDSNQPANENCQQAVQQANDDCAGWQGGPLPPACAQAINQVLPQAVERIEAPVPQPPVEGPNGENPPPADANRSLPNSQPPLNGTPQPQDPNQPGNPPPNGAQAPCVAQGPNTQCPPMQSTANPAGNNNGYPPPPANPNDPKGTPGPNLTPGGQQNPPPPQTTNVPPPPPAPDAPPRSTQSPDAPSPPPDAPPPQQATNVLPPAPDAPPPPPPAPQATSAPPPPQATDAPAPQATSAPPPPPATSAPAPQATAKPQPTTKPPPPPPPPPPRP